MALLNTLRSHPFNRSITEIRYPSDHVLDKNLNLHNNTLIRAYVLPEDVKWPFFDSANQKGSLLTNVVFARNIVAQLETINGPFNNLLQSESSLIFGNPGIGKTALMNILLMRAIDEMQSTKGESFTTIYARMPRFTIRFTYSPHMVTRNSKSSKFSSQLVAYLPDCNMEVELIATPARKTTVSEWERYNNSNTIMLADLDEDEKDPKFDDSVSVVFSMSLRDLYNDAKSWMKGMIHPDYLADPHSAQEIEAISRIMYRLVGHTSDMRSILSDQEYSVVKTEDKFVDVILRRTQMVGPLMRHIFSFDQYMGQLNKIRGTQPSTFWGNEGLAYVNGMNLPTNAKLFVGNFVKSHHNTSRYLMYKVDCGDSNDYDPYQSMDEIRALSVPLARRIANFIKTVDHLDVVKRVSNTFTYQIQESAMLENGVLARPEYPINLLGERAQKRFVGWQFFNASDIDGTLADTNWVDANATQMPFPSCVKSVVFNSNLLKSNIKRLSDNCAYRSLKGNGWLFDALSLNNSETLSAFLWQATEQDPAKHVIDLETLETVCENLGLLKEDCQYRVYYIMVASKHVDPSLQHGLKFKMEGNNFTWSELCDELQNKKQLTAFDKFLLTRFEPWIARAPFLPSITGYASPGGDDRLSSLSLDQLSDVVRHLEKVRDVSFTHTKRRSKKKMLKFIWNVNSKEELLKQLENLSGIMELFRNK